MSEELIVFNQRATDLSSLLKSLIEVNVNEETTSDLRALQLRLKFLSSIVRNRGTLNTGGHFEWVDSKIVTALKTGQYICLEHVNLCSSAILDRLNSVFETNGKLLLSEKGVESNNQSESVSKHSEFRAFLTLDPRNGEISRAMRNRCIELSLVPDTYSGDDLKEVIYLNGIHEMHLVEWTLNIHHRLQQISEFHPFNVSHLSKFAFLINENLRLGSDEPTALFDSALVVYVRSSHVDLLGMGIQFYHDKLTEEIRNEIHKVPDKCQNCVNLSNLIISADNLNSFALIRMQAEPFIISVQCLLSGLATDKVQYVFNAAREKFANLEIQLDWKSAEYLLHMFYNISSVNDVTAREQYIHSKIGHILSGASESDQSQLNHLIQLNGVLAQSIRESSSNVQNREASLLSVPWNQHLLPRLRNYSYENALFSKVDQLKLTAILLANSLFDKIEADVTKVKQSHINVITYSKAVSSGTIPNGLNIDMITHLHPFLDYIKTFTIETIRTADAMSLQQQTTLVCAYFWANRLYEVSKSRLFKEKSADQAVVDKLALHFNWVVKHLISGLSQIGCDSAPPTKELIQFRKALQNISECNVVRRHPLNEMRKQFTKKLTEFAPFYEQNQILAHEHQTKLGEHLQLPTKKWQSHDAVEYAQELLNKYRILLSDESMSYKNYLAENTNAADFQSIECGNAASFDDQQVLQVVNELTKCQTAFCDVGTCASLEDLTEQNANFVKYLESFDGNSGQTHLAPIKLIVSALPIMEYFALRALNGILAKHANTYKPNMEFFKSIRSLDTAVLNLVRTIATERYGIGESLWNWLQQKQLGGEELESILSTLQQSIYKKVSSYMKMLDSRIAQFAYSSLAMNHQKLLAADSIKPLETIPLDSCVLTMTTFLSLYDESGRSKSIGLGNLEVWSTTLNSLSKLLWNNVETLQSTLQFEQTNIDYSVRNGRKLLSEIKYIQSVTASKGNSQTEQDFLELVQELQTKIQSECNLNSPMETRFQQFYTSALIQMLTAVLELQLMTFTPLVDPVEKNRLKKAYTEENQQHLSRLVATFDFMKIIMAYDGLGEEPVQSLHAKDNDLKSLMSKYSEKCALRPEQCVYVELVDQIKFFLENVCRPKLQLQLIADIDSAFNKLNAKQPITQQDIQHVDEVIKRINWCTNTAESFERSTISRFSTYYRDFTAPLQSSVIVLKNSLRSLKQCLIRSREMVFNFKFAANSLDASDSLSAVLANLIEFPNVEKRQHLVPSTIRALDSLDNAGPTHSL